MRFQDNVVMISGAASGFGRAAAKRFAEEGAALSLCDVNMDGLAETAAMVGKDVLTVQVDVADQAQQQAWMAQTRDRFDRVDIAVNNAGVLHKLKSILETPIEEYDRMMRINARGTYVALQTQVPVMIGQGGGIILNMASVAGLIGAQGFGAYVASKHAVVGLTKTAAIEYAPANVRINAICPAFGDTPMLQRIADNRKTDETEDHQAVYDRLTKGLPMRRVGSAEEIVETMLMLCDPANTFMTGQCVAVDGGLTAGR